MWNQDTSKKRAARESQRLQETGITVKRLTREMDLNSLPLTEARVVRGAHLYVDINNFETLVANATLSRENYKPLHRYLHILRREQRHVVQAVFDGDKIQVQAQKFHGILYKPYDDDQKLAWRAVLMGLVMVNMMTEALPEVFPDYPGVSPAVGVSFGEALVANIGVRGNRELISVGSVANHAAKIIRSSGTVTVSSDLWSALNEDHQASFVENDDGTYTLDRNEFGSIAEALSDEGLSWNSEGAIQRMSTDVEELPLNDIESQEAEVLIDLYSLGPKRMKTCSAGAVFVDIDGYTALVDSLLGDEDELAKAVKMVHLFRYELQCVAESDFTGISIQHQGDRMLAIIHLPPDDAEIVRKKLAEMCISFNSSVESVLNSPELKFFDSAYHVSIGAAFGKTVVVRSGVKADLDASCLGSGVLMAERLQLVSKGTEIRVAKEVFSAIKDERLTEVFSFDQNTNSYIAKNLTWQAVDDKTAAKAFAAGIPAAFNIAKKSVEFGSGHDQYRKPLKNPSNWGID